RARRWGRAGVRGEATAWGSVVARDRPRGSGRKRGAGRRGGLASGIRGPVGGGSRRCIRTRGRPAPGAVRRGRRRGGPRSGGGAGRGGGGERRGRGGAPPAFPPRWGSGRRGRVLRPWH